MFKYSSSVRNVERKMSDRKHLKDLLNITGLPVFGCFTLISEKNGLVILFLEVFFEREDEKLILTGFFTSNIMELSFQKMFFFFALVYQR